MNPFPSPPPPQPKREKNLSGSTSLWRFLPFPHPFQPNRSPDMESKHQLRWKRKDMLSRTSLFVFCIVVLVATLAAVVLLFVTRESVSRSVVFFPHQHVAWSSGKKEGNKENEKRHRSTFLTKESTDCTSSRRKIGYGTAPAVGLLPHTRNVP